MPDEYSAEELDVEQYEQLIEQHNPSLIVASSSGGTIITELVSRKKWSGATWIISARKVETLSSLNPDLPVLFSHGTEDNLNYMNNVILPSFSRASLRSFEGGHLAESLFENEEEVKKLLEECWNLRNAV
eukprot:CAMPEP_0174271626 /NCGR_PEP_ID=MMETSP0439-20130205/48508_1 /TAXON_ID=0 /ORGANISM="Stereomyxa ramosa, Strain Chinc5" /LENGTH=129 /DNA_ID=CAMNT_0015361747 /DNA_START=69 /DNA_END=454 /DNA_ORIENTATION=-